MKQNKIIAVILLGVSLGLALAAWLLLPDTVITQLSLSGEASSTLPKAAAVLLPLILGGGGAAMQFFSNTDESGRKGLLLSAVGIAILVIMMLVNL